MHDSLTFKLVCGNVRNKNILFINEGPPVMKIVFITSIQETQLFLRKT